MEFLLIGFLVWMMLLVVAIAICRAAGRANQTAIQDYDAPRDEIAPTSVRLHFPTA